MSFGKIELQNISYFKVLNRKCFILNTKEILRKFDSRSDIGILLEYSSTRKTYRVHNKTNLVVEESMHVTFDETNHLDQEKGIANDIGLEIPL